MVVAFHYVGYAAGLGAPRVVNLLLRPVSLGWSGVDLFFVLSGFLIGGILLDKREAPNYFRVFYRRRLCRIFPLYFAYLAVVLLASRLSRSPLEDLFNPVVPWSACAAFCQNFWMAIHGTTGSYAMGQTWSLAIEEQFYLTIPAVIYFVKPSRFIWVVSAGIVLAPLIRLAMFLVDPRLSTAIYVLLPCRMDSLLFGIAAAYLLRRPGAWEFIRAHRRQLWTAIELLTVACALFLIRPSPFNPLTMFLGYDCLGLLYVCVLVASMAEERFARILRTKWLMGLGTIAYCVYLIHTLIFGLVFGLVKDHRNSGAIAAIGALFLTIVVAKMSWDWFEKPFVKLGHREGYKPSRTVVNQLPGIAGFTIANSAASANR